jgi:hypothetical protein
LEEGEVRRHQSMVDRRPYIAEASTGNATEKESCRSRGNE